MDKTDNHIMKNYTRVGTPVQVFSESFGFLPGHISSVVGSQIDVICLTSGGVRFFEDISHADSYVRGDVRPFWRHVPQDHCVVEHI